MIPALPEPCDTTEPDTRPVPPLGWWDLRGQLADPDVARIELVPIPEEIL